MTISEPTRDERTDRNRQLFSALCDNQLPAAATNEVVVLAVSGGYTEYTFRFLGWSQGTRYEHWEIKNQYTAPHTVQVSTDRSTEQLLARLVSLL